MSTRHSIRVKYSNTPTPLPPAPRRVWIPSPVLDLIWTCRLGLILMALLSVPILSCCLFYINWARYAQNVPGTVVHGSISQYKGRQTYSVEYQFGVGNETLSSSEFRLSEEEYASLSPWKDKPVVVRYYRWGWYWDSALVLGQPTDPRIGMIAPIVVGLIWISGFLVLFYAVGYSPMREYATYCYGRVTTGVVISKVDHSGEDSENYVVTFKFLDESGRKIFREVRVDRNGAFGADVGDEVTVVYDPRSPRRWSFCYEVGEMFVKNASARELRLRKA